jgi:hypothetical protein
MKAFVCGFFLAIAMVTQGQEMGFEAPEFEIGKGVPQGSGWTAEGDVLVSGEQSASGKQSILIESQGCLAREIERHAGLVFRDVAVLPVYENVAKTVLDLGGAQLGYQKVGREGVICAYDGDTPVLIDKKRYSLPEGDNLGEDWVRVTVRIDYAQGVWDLYLDGEPVKSRLRLGDERRRVSFSGSDAGGSYYDGYLEANANPLFPDTDQDGMPDAEEKAMGLNAYADDRDEDKDCNGVSNVREFFGEDESNLKGGSASPANYVFVDNANGSDRNSGRRSYGGSEGPKASLKAAMSAASVGSIIVVMKGVGVYDEGSRGDEEKSLTIKAIEPVTIR